MSLRYGTVLSKRSDLFSQNLKSSVELTLISQFGVFSSIRTRRSEYRYGGGRRRTASAMLKIAVLAPIPSARMETAAARNQGCLESHRRADRRSRVIRNFDTFPCRLVPAPGYRSAIISESFSTVAQ